MLQGDEHYYEQGLKFLEAENERLRSLVERVATDLEADETPNPDELRAELNPGGS